MKHDSDPKGTPTSAPATAAAPTEGLTIRVKFSKPKRGGRVTIIEPGTEEVRKPTDAPPSVPTIVRSLVRAHAYERLVRSGAATSYADVAAMVKQTTARLAQLAALLNLAPDVQAGILDLAAPENRGVSVDEKEVRKIANEPDWSVQRTMWRARALSTPVDAPTGAAVTNVAAVAEYPAVEGTSLPTARDYTS